MASQKPKILFVITQGGPWGGAQRYVFDLATSVQKEFDVTVAVGEPEGEKNLQRKLQGSENNEQKTVGGTVIQLQHLRRNISPLHDLLAIRELRALYRDLHPDIVHLNSSKAGVLGALAAIGTDVHVVYTAHGWVFTEPGTIKKALYFFLEWVAARLRDETIVLSRSDRDIAEKRLRIDPTTIQYTPLGVTPLSSSFHAPSETYRILCVANFFPTKGVDLLIQSFIHAFGDTDRVRLTLIGDGPERERLLCMVPEPQRNNQIIFAGFLPDAASTMNTFDLLVIPSRKEGLPYALLEALYARIPVVATAVGDIPNHIRDKKTGLLVAPEDVPALAAALRYAYEHQDDMIHMAKTAAEPPSVEQMIKQTISLYRLPLAPEAKSNS